FFFSSRRRHTRFSRDWSSDVCSSDLDLQAERLVLADVDTEQLGCRLASEVLHADEAHARGMRRTTFTRADELFNDPLPLSEQLRSEERRVGKECRSGWSPDV